MKFLTSWPCLLFVGRPEPFYEGDGKVHKSYYNIYDPVLAVKKHHIVRAVKMENTKEGDGYKYRDRGYVQIIWKRNYRLVGEYFGIDLVKNPD